MKLNADLKLELHSDLQELHKKWRHKDISLDEDSDVALGNALGVAIESTKKREPRFTAPFTEQTNNSNNSPCKALIKSFSTIKCNSKSPVKSPSVREPQDISAYLRLER